VYIDYIWVGCFSCESEWGVVGASALRKLPTAGKPQTSVTGFVQDLDVEWSKQFSQRFLLFLNVS